MKQISIYLTLLFLISLSSCRDRPGLIVEVTGRVFADSAMTIPVEGAEVVILNRRKMNRQIFSDRYVEDMSGFTDSTGAYTVIATSQEDLEYYTWVKPNALNNTSSKNFPKLKEWKVNEEDFVLKNPLIYTINLKPDSLYYSPQSLMNQKIFITGDHRIIAPGLRRQRENEMEFDITWRGDTTLHLILEKDTWYSINMGFEPCTFPYRCGNHWIGTTSRSDSMEVTFYLD